MPRAWTLAVVAAATVVATPGVARSYEFAARTRTLAQIYQVRRVQLVGDDMWLSRRRFSQSLTLTVWDLGDLAAKRRQARRPGGGVTVSWQSHLQLDHDFGAFVGGQVAGPRSGSGSLDALDAIPELSDDALNLALMYGYLRVDGIADDRVGVRLGRMVGYDSMDFWVVDGAEVSLRPPVPVEVVVMGGRRVRESSGLASSRMELDGTSAAECQEYVEGATAGGGRWQLIDRSRVLGNLALGSDLYVCPQRDTLQPTIGATLRTRGLGFVDAGVSYRRTQSRTVGVFDRVDRLDNPDLGLYPNEFGQAPGWGVNEEFLALTARARWKPTDNSSVAPWAWLRQSLVQARIDRAALGVTLRHGAHRLEPEVAYVLPTFDSDSIFSVFAVEPSTDMRLTWSMADDSRGDKLTMTSAVWARAYSGEDDVSWAYGGQAALARRIGRAWEGRASAIADDGVGGRRLAGTVDLRWHGRTTTLGGNLAVWDVRPDELTAGDRGSVTSVLSQASATVRLSDLAAVHALVETSSDRFTPLAVRTLAVIDLAFEPEM